MVTISNHIRSNIFHCLAFFNYIIMPVLKTFSINDEENNRKYLIEEMPIEGGFVILDELREECTYLDIDESKELLEWMNECLKKQTKSI